MQKRKIFYVDVGKQSPRKVRETIRRIHKSIKEKKLLARRR